MTEIVVFVNGQAVPVPPAVDCYYAARGALGLPRGVGACLELGLTGRPDGEPLDFQHGYAFRPGERFIVVGWDDALSIWPVDTPPEPWALPADSWKDDGEPKPTIGIPMPAPGIPADALADILGEPPLEDDHLEVEEWGLCVTVPQLELQLHEKLGAVVAVFGPWLREMVAGLADDQDRLAWSLLPDSDETRRNVHEAVLRSLKLTPKDMVKGEEDADEAAD